MSPPPSPSRHHVARKHVESAAKRMRWKIEINRNTNRSEKGIKRKEMSIKCLFGHKWDGCKCVNCDTTRDEWHNWLIVEGKCIEKCSICGKERRIENKNILCEAVAKITDQKILIDVAKNDEDEIVRSIAIRQLTDQDVLADIAKNETNNFLRSTAVEKLTNQIVLAYIVKNDKTPSVRRDAVIALTDQSTLIFVAQNESDYRIRGEAIKKLTDQAVLGNIALNDGRVGYMAVQTLTDRNVLEYVQKNTKDIGIVKFVSERYKELDGK